MIEYINVPKIFNNIPQWNNPPYHRGPHLEKYFDKFVQKHLKEIDKNISYLPLYWTDYYVPNSFGKDKIKIKDLQKYLDYLPRDKKYFTVIRNADGVMNDISFLDIIVFGAGGFDKGGVAHIPIPLLCDPMPTNHIDKNMKKDIFVGFVGSDTHKMRREIFNKFKNINNYFIVETGCNNFMNIKEYSEILFRSVFLLCPRGYGQTSFRLYESMQVGSIPVYIYDNPWIPFIDEVKWEDFCVFVHEDQIDDIPNILKSFSSEKIEQMSKSLRENYIKYFTMEQTCKMILNIINKIL